MSELENNHLVMITGKSATGKSASLAGLTFDESGKPKSEKEQARVMYLNTESGKRLPFANKFKPFTIIDPLQVNEAFEFVINNPDVYDTIIIDSQTFLMEQYESQYVLTSQNTMAAWSNFQQYFKKIMQYYVPQVTQQVVFTAHTLDILNENEMVVDTKIPVKGALKHVGIESFFACIISTKRMLLNKLKDYKNPFLTITPEEEIDGFKYVYQTRLTKETIGERIRSPIGMWTQQETFIDNNIALVFKRLNEYYA